jgi:hypothetical protein
MTFLIGTPHTHNAGYCRNDDTPSGGQLTEADIQTCTHCQKIIKMQEWRLAGAWCHHCGAPICMACGERALIYGCEPFVKQLEAHLRLLTTFEHYLKVAEPTPAVQQPLVLAGS